MFRSIFRNWWKLVVETIDSLYQLSGIKKPRYQALLRETWERGVAQ